ncbi:hypothetical protein ASL71_12185 [Salmonella enterica subsp. enterica serovar Isangi]|nr:hypothetical protein [Salmonella enterica subsp. enterica serovar Isangi]EDO4448090.1 hypothetical protein [Salmonella enterica]ECS2307103.1 hypothetical protein [Salmonella enterica subsp. enterica serovar Isangi]ECT5203625.1 hypothetical protein [Salmonella enterica subsp. enterica serovar Isangi]ECT5265057.1 hypothetical protein [Salmonella enterica subsp. enterica serovar Isangi]
MKLIDVLVQELPRRGGWPEGVEEIWQDYDRLMRPLGWFHDELCEDHRRQHHDAHVKISRKQYEDALAASKAEWDGKGLPPSGNEFEYLRGDFGADEGRWIKCTMKYAGEKYCIVHLEGEGESWLRHEGTKIRPIRSEADKKRDESIKALKFSFGAFDVNGLADMVYHAIAAGKIPHIRIN